MNNLHRYIGNVALTLGLTFATSSVLTSAAVAQGTQDEPEAAANALAQTFFACYVEDVGAMYLIKLPGLPTACLSANHKVVSWTEGAGVTVADGSITTNKLADGAVTAAKLAPGAVPGVADESIGTQQLADDAVTTPKIADGTVTAAKLAPGVITGIANGSVDTQHLADDAVTAAKLADDAVDTDIIADGSIAAADIGVGQVGTSEIADGSVSSADIQNGTITQADMAAGSVGFATIIDESINANKLRPNSVNSDEIATGAVGADEIATGAVGAAEIAANSVRGSELSVGYTRVLSAPTAVDVRRTISVDCPAGLEVVSGGWHFTPSTGGAPANINGMWSYPVDDNTWSVRLENNVATDGIVTVIAICADLK